MSLVFYASRVRRNFHRLPPLAFPLIYVMLTLSWDVSLLIFSHFNFPPFLTPVSDTYFIPLGLGLAALGMDTSEGLLPVLLTRPLRRSSYVLGHWAALGTVACFWSLLHLLLQWSLIEIVASNHTQPIDILYNGLDRISLCFGMAAVLVCMSARLPAYGNVVLWGVLYYVCTRVLPAWIKDDELGMAYQVRQYLFGLLMPVLDFRRTFAATPISWARLTTYLSNVSLLLLLALHIFNRREVSYASR